MDLLRIPFYSFYKRDPAAFNNIFIYSRIKISSVQN